MNSFSVLVEENSGEKTFFLEQYSVQVEDTIMFLCDAKSSKAEDNGAYLLN